MNWLDTIVNVIGGFWSDVFGDQDFIRSVERVHEAASTALEDDVDRTIGSSIDFSGTGIDKSLQFPIYMRTDTGSAAFSIADAINGSKALASESLSNGYVAVVDRLYAVPDYITNKADDAENTLFKDIDYIVDGDGNITFYVDPSTLGFRLAYYTDSTGMPSTYWVAFGWVYGRKYGSDAVEAFYNPRLAPYSDIVWDMHQRGATYFTVGKLLAAASGSVVSENDGIVERIWTESGYTCMLVDGIAYSSPVSNAVVSVGSAVRKGDTLFGDVVLMSGSDSRIASMSSILPRMLVRTDAGSLVAENSSKTATVYHGINILPLSGDASAMAVYNDICKEKYDDPTAAKLVVPSSVNPMTFVLSVLRRGKSAVSALAPVDLPLMAAALSCIRKNMDAASILSVYLQADTDTASVPISFSADVGNAAVATTVTATIKDAFAEADTHL